MAGHKIATFRMSPEEKAKLAEMCRSEDLSMAQWMRRAINTAYKKYISKSAR